MNLKYERSKWKARMLLRAERAGNQNTQKIIFPESQYRSHQHLSEREIFIRESGWEAYEWQRR